MAGMKKLINRTGNELKVKLIVRRSNHTTETAGTVDLDLAAGPDNASGEDRSEQDVTYGNDLDIYLNGIETTMIVDGSAVGKRQVVVERGSEIDKELNTNDTIEFLFDGESILISATNSGEEPFTFAAM
jgi:hypothetical protein